MTKKSIKNKKKNKTKAAPRRGAETRISDLYEDLALMTTALTVTANAINRLESDIVKQNQRIAVMESKLHGDIELFRKTVISSVDRDISARFKRLAMAIQEC